MNVWFASMLPYGSPSFFLIVAALALLRESMAAGVVTDGAAPRCPKLKDHAAGICVEKCSSDSDCPVGRLCCSNGCGHVCMLPESEEVKHKNPCRLTVTLGDATADDILAVAPPPHKSKTLKRLGMMTLDYADSIADCCRAHRQMQGLGKAVEYAAGVPDCRDEL
eukprot:NODE_25781_length_575_cov_4.754464.p1 GENE.NODE_25781_length_575_cov_4.754464~~NODE_25781_length_575_cov_4.754464.p1  ORF type:complete len:165 (+),score=18.45 NODE_25781_length_575_cov_4.754464:42-536(+)